MDRHTLDVAIPMIYGLAVVVAALTSEDAVTLVAVVGGVLVALWFSAVRPSWVRRDQDRGA